MKEWTQSWNVVIHRFEQERLVRYLSLTQLSGVGMRRTRHDRIRCGDCARAEADLEDIFGYIAYELEVGESACKIVDDLYEAIAKLNVMPKRFRIIDREPWKSRGVRFMFVDNYRVHYVVDDDKNKVTVLRVMYCRADS